MFHKKVAPPYQALLLPVLLTIVPLCIQWENEYGVVRKKGAGGGGIVVVEATLFGCVSYLHPELGDRLVMVGDRMTSHISPQFEPLLKEWQRPGSGRTESDIDELISERHLRSRDNWDLKVQYVPGKRGNHYNIGFAGDAFVQEKFADDNVERGRAESMHQLAEWVDSSYRKSKAERGQPIERAGYLSTDGRNFHWLDVGRRDSNVRVKEDPRNLIMYGQRSQEAATYMDKYHGVGPEQRAVATDEQVEHDLRTAFTMASRRGKDFTSVSTGFDGYRHAPGQAPVRIGYEWPGEKEELERIPFKTTEEIARKLLRDGKWSQMLERGDPGLTQWRQQEEERMAREQRQFRSSQLRPSRPYSGDVGADGAGPTTSGTSSSAGGAVGKKERNRVDSKSSSFFNSEGLGYTRSSSKSSGSRSPSTSSTGRNEEPPPVPAHLSRLERRQQRERSERENQSGSSRSSSRDRRNNKKEQQRSSSRSGNRKRSRSRGSNGGGRGRRFG